MEEKNINIAHQKSIASYDEFPYLSHPFYFTRPEYLKTIGVLFGMEPPMVENARILELGCASGGNIINFAESYPKSYTLGIDLSKVQVEDGTKKINELGLKNIELKHMSITDLDESYGKFDYIICHGVFSWVPEFVQKKIIEISKQLLSPNGIAFISYNTLPGWNMMNTIRDMMMFHASTFENTHDQVQQAKLFLNFVVEGLENSTSSYAKFLRIEAEQLVKKEDSYLRHEYLSEENKQFYFHEFINQVTANGLIYLADAQLASMFLGNLPPKAAEKLHTINDIVRSEQYMDFIQNKRFRSTLLCHNNIKLNRNITMESVVKFYLASTLVAEKPEKEIEINNSLENISFKLREAEGLSITTSSPIMKAIFYTLGENHGNPLLLNELFKLAHKKLLSCKIEDFEQEFNQSFGRLLFSGFFKIFSIKPKAIYKISSKPKASKLAIYQAKNGPLNKLYITNQNNEIVLLHHHEKFILELLDGNHTIDQLNEEILKRFKVGDLIVNLEDKKVEDPELLQNIAKDCVNLTLENFKKSYMLVQ